MATNRLEILKSLLEQNPQDSFARYGLAMEYAKAGDLEQAVSEFRAVLAGNGDYSYAYFHGGQTLEKLGRVEEARRGRGFGHEHGRAPARGWRGERR